MEVESLSFSLARLAWVRFPSPRIFPGRSARKGDELDIFHSVVPPFLTLFEEGKVTLSRIFWKTHPGIRLYARMGSEWVHGDMVTTLFLRQNGG